MSSGGKKKKCRHPIFDFAGLLPPGMPAGIVFRRTGCLANFIFLVFEELFGSPCRPRFSRVTRTKANVQVFFAKHL
jgi:hypothetical protein